MEEERAAVKLEMIIEVMKILVVESWRIKVTTSIEVKEETEEGIEEIEGIIIILEEEILEIETDSEVIIEMKALM